MHRVYLEFREGNSDKFYRIIAAEANGTWITNVWWGRRGSQGQNQVKYMGPSEAQALASLQILAASKRAKGYVDALDPLGPAASTAPPAAPGIFTAPLVTPMPNPQSWTLPRFPAMKAKEVDIDWGSLSGYVMEEKFDGHRAMLTFDTSGIVVRNVYGEDKGKIQNIPHIQAHLEDIERNWAYNLHAGTIIDGEMVGLTLAETTHLLGGAGRTDPRLKFVAFDLPYLAGKDLRDEEWIHRRNKLQDLIGGAKPGPVTIAALHTPTYAQVQAIWATGGEGAILKPADSPYVPGGRNHWIKIKEHHTAEAIVTGWEPGKGKYTNQLGTLVLSQYRGGVLTEVTKVSGMTDADRKSMTSDWDSWLYSVIEFEYQQKTPTGSYRHPRYVRPRPDKKQTECLWETSP